MLTFNKCEKRYVFCIFLKFELEIKRNLKFTNKMQFLKYNFPLKTCEMLVYMHTFLCLFYLKTYTMDMFVLVKERSLNNSKTFEANIIMK